MAVGTPRSGEEAGNLAMTSADASFRELSHRIVCRDDGALGADKRGELRELVYDRRRRSVQEAHPPNNVS